MIEVCAGFDGSESDDWTVLRAETLDGHQFTPRYGGLPTLWNPAEHGGRIPRGEVDTAISELFAQHKVIRLYFDPRGWRSEIEAWAQRHGDDVVLEWSTFRVTQMHAALDRFTTDLASGGITHDGCPVTAVHMANARRVPKPGERYILGKPSQSQKIDAAVASVLAHEAAADARAAGWGQAQDNRILVFR